MKEKKERGNLQMKNQKVNKALVSTVCKQLTTDFNDTPDMYHIDKLTN